MTRTGFLNLEQSVQRLTQLAFLESAAAHILAGWIVKTPLLDVKIYWGQELASSMEHASRIRERAVALTAASEAGGCIPSSWREYGRSIDRAQDTQGVLRGLYGLKQHLVARCAEYLDRADPVADAASIRLVESARRSASARIKWMRKRIGAARPEKPFESIAARTRTTDGIALEEALWAPLDRVPRVVRPAGMRRGEPGALRELPVRPRSRKDTGLFLHNFLNEEFTTLELVARNSYEHPHMPWSFHLDMARHAGDEARHAQLFVRALEDYGLRYGDHPVYTYSYEGEYEFPSVEPGEEAPCRPGSQRELLWRILLRQVVHEGMALDSTAFEIQKRRHLRQPELARLFGFILADEVFHAGSGLKWSRYLVGGEEAKLERERDMAYQHYAERLKDRRLAWGAGHIEEAAAEAEQLEQVAQNYRLPFRSQVNAAARRRAGFSEDQIRRLIEEMG